MGMKPAPKMIKRSGKEIENFVKIPVDGLSEDIQDILHKLFSLLEALNEGIIFISPNRSILFANKKALNILGVKKRQDIIGRQWESMISEKDRLRCVQYYLTEVYKKKTGKILLTIDSHSGKKMIDISSSALSSHGHIIGYREVIREFSVKEISLMHNFNDASFSALVNNVPGIVYYSLYDKEFTLLFGNKYMSRVTGYPHTDFLNNAKRKFTDLIYPEDLQKNSAIIKKALEKNEPFEVEYRVMHKNGTYRWLIDRGRGIRDSAGNITYLSGVSIDITDKKEIEEKVYNNEKRLSAIFENAALAVVIMDVQGNYLQNNKTAERMLGLRSNELKGKNFRDTSHPDDLNITQKAVNSILQGDKKTITYENRLFKKDGSLIWGRITLNAITNKDRQPTFIIAFAENITQQHGTREKLEESEERYRNLVTSIPGVVFNSSTEPDWEMYFISNQIKLLSGYDAEDFLRGKKRLFASIIHPADREMIAHDNMNPGSDSPPYAIEYRIIHKDKSIRWVHETGQAYFDRTLNKYCLTGVIVDISPRITAEENQRLLMHNLQRAYKEVNEFAHIVSHDLKAPLRGISSLSTWLYEDYYDKLEEEGRNNLLLLQDRVEKMDALIDGILAYSSVGKGAKQIEEVNLNKVVQSVCDMLELPAGFRVSIKKQLPTVRANNYHMYQLFQNLISNALKYNDKAEGRVWIDFSSKEAEWIFTIKDNGVGISKEYLHKIFDIFQTLNTKDRKSSGVGLSIVKKIVEIYHGEIDVESEPGKGTTFTFSLHKDPETANKILNERK